MAVEDDAEHVVDLALLVVGGRPTVGHRRHVGGVERDAELDREPVQRVAVQQLVLDAEPRLLGEVVDPVDAHEVLIALGPERFEHLADHLGHDVDRALVAEELGAEHGLGVRFAQLLGQQLCAGCVRHPGHLRPGR